MDTAAVSGISTFQINVPVLVNRSENPVLGVRVAEGECVKALRLSFGGTTDLADLRAIRVVRLRPEAEPNEWTQIAAHFGPVRVTSEAVSVSLDQEGVPGPAIFWVLLELSPSADLAHRVRVRLIDVETEKRAVQVTEESPVLSLRFGYRLRHAGDDGSKGYRIPGLVQTSTGTLVACYDIRREGNRDLQGNIDIGVSRSMDCGQTWEPMQVALSMAAFGGLPAKYNGVSDGALLVDRQTGRLFVFGCWMHGLRDDDGLFVEGMTEESTEWAHQWHSGRRGSGPGMGPRETSQFLMAWSDDDGRSWSEPVNLTSELKHSEWYLFCPAPGCGITASDGTLVLPAQGRDADMKAFSTIVLSRDHGSTWKRARVAQSGTNECAVVQLPDGALMLNMRDPGNRDREPAERARGVSVTHDWGETWERHSSDHDAALVPEPVCMASLFRFVLGTDDQERSVLFFSNPNHQEKRAHITIKASRDSGTTWPEAHWVELDELTGAGYSCLARVNERTVGILYESSQGCLVFQRVSIDDCGFERPAEVR